MDNDKANNGTTLAEQCASMIAESLVDAQRSLYALIAIHEASVANPSFDRDFPLLANEIWRALFDRLYVKIGCVLDQSKGSGSFRTLLEIAVVDSEYKNIFDAVYSRLARFDGYRNWRNKAVAHNDPKVDVMALYENQKKHVSEFQVDIDELYSVLNALVLFTGAIYARPSWDERYKIEAMRLIGQRDSKSS